MLGLRLQKANEISNKRWEYYHGKKVKQQIQGIVFENEVHVPKGAYRKSKGCECRGCSARKQEAKRATNSKIRNFDGDISDGGEYKKLM